MMLGDEDLKECGYRPIVSDAQSLHLLRREIKRRRNWSNRKPDRKWSYEVLLAIKKGNWYKFMKNPRNGLCGLMVYRRRQPPKQLLQPEEE